MKAYYNEFDPFAAQWLRNLINGGHIAPGDVDERSIEDVKPSDLHGYTQCHFFAGIGVWSYALRQSGWTDDRPVWTGSCPCQPFSTAGKRNGVADERHLWPAWFHLIEQCLPSVVFGEQVASKDGLSWLDLVQSDLEGEGYAFGAADLCAAGVGAPHIRQRLYFAAKELGHADDTRPQGHRQSPYLDGAERRQDAGRHGAEASMVGEAQPGPTNGHWRDADWLFCRDGKWRPVEPGTFPLAHGSASRVGRLRAYGNAIHAQTAQAFIESYMQYTQQ